MAARFIQLGGLVAVADVQVEHGQAGLGEGQRPGAGGGGLGDGSWISRIADPAAAARLRRRKQKVPARQIPGIEVRVVEYTVETEPDQHGQHAVSELFCLVTTLLDQHVYSLEDFPDLYHDRQQIETAIGEVETRLRGGADVVLRSRNKIEADLY